MNTITLQIGGALELILRPPPPVGETIIRTRFEGFEATAKGNHMAYTLPVGKYIRVQIAYVDAAGNAATIDGEVRWESSNPGVATVAPDSGDSSLCMVSAVAGLGTAQVKATGDADLGQGVREIITLLDVTVVAGEAVSGTMNVVGEPADIAPHPEQQAPRR